MKDFEERFQKTTEEGAWNSLVSCAKFYAQHFMHPLMTIIIDQTGIQLFEGQQAKGFELLD